MFCAPAFHTVSRFLFGEVSAERCVDDRRRNCFFREGGLGGRSPPSFNHFKKFARRANFLKCCRGEVWGGEAPPGIRGGVWGGEAPPGNSVRGVWGGGTPSSFNHFKKFARRANFLKWCLGGVWGGEAPLRKFREGGLGWRSPPRKPWGVLGGRNPPQESPLPVRPPVRPSVRPFVRPYVCKYVRKYVGKYVRM